MISSKRASNSARSLLARSGSTDLESVSIFSSRLLNVDSRLRRAASVVDSARFRRSWVWDRVISSVWRESVTRASTRARRSSEASAAESLRFTWVSRSDSRSARSRALPSARSSASFTAVSTRVAASDNVFSTFTSMPSTRSVSSENPVSTRPLMAWTSFCASSFSSKTWLASLPSACSRDFSASRFSRAPSSSSSLRTFSCRAA